MVGWVGLRHTQPPRKGGSERGGPPTASLTVSVPRSHPFSVASEITCGRASPQADLDRRRGYSECVRCLLGCGGGEWQSQAAERHPWTRPLLASVGPTPQSPALHTIPSGSGMVWGVPQGQGLKPRGWPSCSEWPATCALTGGLRIGCLLRGPRSWQVLSLSHLWRVWLSSLCLWEAQAPRPMACCPDTQ